MDYSSLPQDPENPAGTSPWESSSPRAERTLPSPGNTDIPPSPLPPQNQFPYDSEAAQRDPEYVHGGDQKPGSPDLSGRLQHAHLVDPENVESSSPYGNTNQSANSGQNTSGRSNLPARYHTGARQQSKQQTPQYKLQAKITALERTGKKDPILRFDVHVCFDFNVFFRFGLVLILFIQHRPIYPSFEPPSFVIFDGRIQNS